MKLRKSLAAVLSVIMVLTCSVSLFTLFASAEGLTFDWAKEWTTVDGSTRGTWQLDSAPAEGEEFDYDYALDYSDGSLKVGVKFRGTVTGSPEHKGNGQGTNLRFWIRDPETGYQAYNYFIDLMYNGTDAETSMKKNTNPEGNTGAAVEEHTYSYSFAKTSYGADLELVIPQADIGSPKTVQAVVTVSNNLHPEVPNYATNYALYSGVGYNAPSGPWEADLYDELSYSETKPKTDSVEFEIVEGKPVLQAAPWAELKALLDGDLAEDIKGYEGNQSHLVAIQNTDRTNSAAKYNIIFHFAEERIAGRVHIHILNYSNGCVGLPESVTVTANGEIAEGTVEPADGQMNVITADFGEDVTFKDVVITVVNPRCAECKGEFNCYSEVEFERINEPVITTGDIDGNGEIDTVDYSKLKRFVLETLDLGVDAKAAADINGDGRIDAVDYTMLKRYVLGTYHGQPR